MSTESRNPRSVNLSEMSAFQIVRLMNEEDHRTVTAVNECLSEIAVIAEVYAQTLKQGGRVFYLGAGTSGGIAMLDAAEMPPTFGVDEETVIALTAEEGICYTTDDEDSTDKAKQQLMKWQCGEKDLVIGIAASGSTPYVREGLLYAKQTGAVTASVACNKNSLIGTIADYRAEADTGAEVLTGSTRLKAGTAEKMILNMISTAAMTLCGNVYSNYMVDVKPMNAKLVKRARSIVMEVTGCDETTAENAMKQADNHCKTAIENIQHNQINKGGK